MDCIRGQIQKVINIEYREMTEPLGTPLVNKEEDDIPPTTSLILRFERKLSNHLKILGERPFWNLIQMGFEFEFKINELFYKLVYLKINNYIFSYNENNIV